MVLNIFLIILALVLIACFTVNLKNDKKMDSREDLLDKSSTDALKGFSIVMIAMAHICQYEPNLKLILIGEGITYRLIFSWGAIGVSLFFLLSGYGCYLSISKKGQYQYGKWLLKHIIKMLIHFIVAFILVIVLCKLCFGVQMDWNEALLEFVTLRMPGSTVWYFKIQMLFYVFLVLAALISKKNISVIVLFFSLGYAFIADYIMKLPDFWWKTALCFSSGCFLAQYKEKVIEFAKKNYVKIALLVLAAGSYFLLIKDGHYRLYVQLPAYVFISLFITIFWDWLIKGNPILGRLGKCSLDIYLVHIGIVEFVFLLPINVNYKIIMFIGIVGIVTAICYFLAEYIDKKIVSVLKL